MEADIAALIERHWASINAGQKGNVAERDNFLG
jgi:hypothetical protein